VSARIAVGASESLDIVEAFSEASQEAGRGLGGECDLCLVFASGPHLALAQQALDIVHDGVRPRNLIGCGAGGVVGGGREIEDGPGAVVWAASFPDAEIATYHVVARRTEEGIALAGLPDEDTGDGMILLADPYSFPTEGLLAHLNETRPGRPVLGGLASATLGGAGVLFHGGEALPEGAVIASMSGVKMIPCVSQGAAPLGPEMTITACEGNVIHELASKPAISRLAEVLAALPPERQQQAAEGVMLGVVIDENRPDYERGDFLIRPIIGADQEAGTIAIGEQVRVGQTVRLHVRDADSADEDLREALEAEREALASSRAAGALLFTCNGRGSHMFSEPDHDAGAVGRALGVPAAGFFCAGEIGPVGARSFLHGFTATMAVFPAE
jgi:small ligand-binding sensory domain FIST